MHLRGSKLYKIVNKEIWSDAPAIKEIEIVAPEIANKHKAGQFVIIRINEFGERIPLTVARKDIKAGHINLLFQEVGKTTIQLGRLGIGDIILDVVGPLGKPTHIEKIGTVVCIGGGIGVAPVYPITKAMKEAGNKIFSIIGARSKSVLVYEDLMRMVSDRLIVTTDDGSYGTHGFVTDALSNLIEQKECINLVVAIGPPIMMKMVCNVTRPYNILTYVSLNTIMIDGTGMCGACRVTVDNNTRFVCVDGPEFNGHLVDFDEMMQRQKQYIEEERHSIERCQLNSCGVQD